MTMSKEMRRLPKVSIGMPVWNSETSLDQAVEAIRAQTFVDWELIISVNLSTDATLTKANLWSQSDSRITVIGQSENIGALANFDFVRQQARGHYFMWAAGDDLRSPYFLEDAVHLLELDDEVVCVFADLDFFQDYQGSSTWVQARSPVACTRIPVEDFYRFPGIPYAFYGLFRTKPLLTADLNFRGMVKYVEGHEIPFLAQLALEGSLAKLNTTMLKYNLGSSWNTERPSRFQLVSNLTFVLVAIVLSGKLSLPVRSKILWQMLSWNFGGFWVRRIRQRAERSWARVTGLMKSMVQEEGS